MEKQALLCFIKVLAKIKHLEQKANHQAIRQRIAKITEFQNASAGNPLADACRTYLSFKQHMSRSTVIYLNLLQGNKYKAR